MRQRLVHLPGLIAVLALVGLAGVAAGAFAQSQSSIGLVAMDADAAGNTATSLGHLDPCVRAEVGSEVVVDLVVDAVPEDRPFLGYQVDVVYDPAVLQVLAADHRQLLAANGAFDLIDFSEPLPDTDGSFTILVADFASVIPDGNMESGPGVLSRLTLTTIAPGSSSVAPGFDPPDVYPALVDATNSLIEVRSLAGIRVAVGEDCLPGLTEIEPTPLPPLSSLEETPTPTPEPTPAPPEPTLAPTPGPTPAPTPEPTPTPTPEPTPTPTPEPTPSPSPSPTPPSPMPVAHPAVFPATGGPPGDAADLSGIAVGLLLASVAGPGVAWVARRRTS